MEKLGYMHGTVKLECCEMSKQVRSNLIISIIKIRINFVDNADEQDEKFKAVPGHLSPMAIVRALPGVPLRCPSS